MTNLFEFDGPNLARGYINLREGQYATERCLREQLQAMWDKYEPFADPGFREGFGQDPDSRFWEMFLGCALLDSGRSLLQTEARRRQGGQPDICVIDGPRRIWIEAIAPTCGDDGPDQVCGPQPINEGGGFAPVPVREAQLRVTSALWTKGKKIRSYIEEGIIEPDDIRLIAIGGGRFGLYVSDDPFPLPLSAVFPIGQEYVTIDRATGTVVDFGYEPSFSISRQGDPIPRTAFKNGPFGHISGILWSRSFDR